MSRQSWRHAVYKYNYCGYQWVKNLVINLKSKFAKLTKQFSSNNKFVDPSTQHRIKGAKTHLISRCYVVEVHTYVVSFKD